MNENVLMYNGVKLYSPSHYPTDLTQPEMLHQLLKKVKSHQRQGQVRLVEMIN